MRAAIAIILSTLVSAACAATPDPQNPEAPMAVGPALADLKWSARPVVAFAPAPDDARLVELRAAIAARRDGFEERHMALIEVIAADHPLRARFGVPPTRFAAVLVGKDGSEKDRVDRLPDLAPWFARIDAMPMRQAEMEALRTRR